MNNLQQSIILYYADYLSLKDISIPVTDNCKYYFLYRLPMNSAYILDLEPMYDVENKYYQQAYIEYQQLINKFGEDCAQDFVENICNLSAMGTINAKQMLQCIHHYSTRQDRKKAFDTYEKWKSNQTYTQTTINEDGDQVETPCTMYIAHENERKKKQANIAHKQ